MLSICDSIPTLLNWYHTHNRFLPWRVREGVAEPYKVWLSEIMCQQTTSAAVVPYFEKFLHKWPNVKTLANATQDEVLSAWAGLGYYSRARNLHACAQLIADQHQGQFPRHAADLQKLPGIGAYTAAAIASICFNQRVAVVDGNVMRVVARVYTLPETRPQLEARVREILTPLIPSEPATFAQAMMDLGNQICTPKNPKCDACPLSPACAAYKHGTQIEYPKKPAKIEKPIRNIALFAVLRGDQILLRQRPAKGLLASMTEIPSAGWSSSYMPGIQDAPMDAQFTLLPESYTHVFTHFTAHVRVWRADVPANTPAPDGMWFCKLSDVDSHALPSIMRKGVNLISPHPGA